MPIRPEFRLFYRTASWRARRARVLARAGGRFDLEGNYLGGACCEHCGARDGAVGIRDRDGVFHERWESPAILAAILEGARATLIQLGVAHLKFIPREDEPDTDLAALCRRCHLKFDASWHKRTRATRKDRAGPILVEASA